MRVQKLNTYIVGSSGCPIFSDSLSMSISSSCESSGLFGTRDGLCCREDASESEGDCRSLWYGGELDVDLFAELDVGLCSTAKPDAPQSTFRVNNGCVCDCEAS